MTLQLKSYDDEGEEQLKGQLIKMPYGGTMLVWREARTVECKGQSDRRQSRDVARSQTIEHVVKNQSGTSQCTMESHHTTKEMCSFQWSHTPFENRFYTPESSLMTWCSMIRIFYSYSTFSQNASIGGI